ncbi:MAG: NUDIX hydrolase [Candidatus Eisenbacteria bacterium]|nr:NUDIX hydrolase [Candidatus Eisenbacteria bacterium]
MRRWTRLSRETLFTTPWCRFEHDRFRLPDGAEGDYYYVNSPGAVMVVALDDRDQAVLVRQYRYLLDRDSVEFPAGGLREGVEPLEQARRELEEEAGYRAGRWEELGSFASWNGVTNEVCRVFLARDLSPSEGTPDPTEEFEVFHLAWREVLARAARGEIDDGMTLASIALARDRIEGAGGARKAEE